MAGDVIEIDLKKRFDSKKEQLLKEFNGSTDSQKLDIIFELMLETLNLAFIEGR